ncbi:MAG: S41 family peptidase [Oscillospiraceae bacterium]|nr:S41 family peptidase [Oscillospiraceae bacterium]
MFKKLHVRIICLILPLALLILPLAPAALAVSADPAEQLLLLREIDLCIAEYYLEGGGELRLPPDLTPEDFDGDLDRFYEELEKLTADFDLYSWFMEKELYDFFFGSPEAPEPVRRYGIGIMLDPYRTTGAYIYGLLPGGAAEEAGLLPGDQIVSVNGTDTRALPFDEIADLLRGEQGTGVRVGVRRPGALEDREYTLTRRALPGLPTYVMGYVMEDGTGYISISSFMNEETDVQAFALFMEHFRTRGVTDLVIDLRDNGGGIVDEMRDILCLLDGLEGELLYRFIDRDGTEIPYTYEAKGAWSPLSITILVNGGTASAAEMMAGSLQDRGLATVVGTQTFGKARAQMHYVLTGGDILALTRYRIELPVTGDYQEVGLTPDIEIEMEIVTLDISALETLNASRAILPGLSPASRTMALEQRLWMLGYFLDEPDDVFDAYTLHALNCFQMAEGLTVTSYGSVQTLELLESYIEPLDGLEYAASDNQLEFVLDRLKIPAEG